MIIFIAELLLLIANIAVLGINISFVYKNKTTVPKSSRCQNLSQSPAPANDETSDAERRAQRKYEAEQAAFEEMMNFNIEKAYGIKPKDFDA